MNTLPKPVALVDLDGTLADYHGAMLTALAKLESPEESYANTSTEPMSFSEAEELPHLRARMELMKASPGWWEGLKPLDSGLTLVNALRVLGFRITILSRGPKNHPDVWAQKFRWCQRWVPDARVTITSDEKSRVYGRVLVDDWVPYVEPWLKRRPRGLVVMPHHPWNAGFEHPQVARYTGANNLPAVYARLEEQARRT